MENLIQIMKGGTVDQMEEMMDGMVDQIMKIMVGMADPMKETVAGTAVLIQARVIVVIMMDQQVEDITRDLTKGKPSGE